MNSKAMLVPMGAAGLVAGVLVLAGCTSSGGSTGASGSAASVSSTTSSTTSSIAAPSGATSSAGTTSSAAAPPHSSTAAAAGSSAKTSANATTVPTGTVAPYPTPARVPTLPSDQSHALAAVPGSASASCAQVAPKSNVLRSGALAAGDFASALDQFRSPAGKGTPEVSLYVIPQHAAHMKNLTVTVRNQGTGASKTVRSQSVEDGDTSRYYTVAVPVATAGKYRLSMVSGTDKGCFLVTFSR